MSDAGIARASLATHPEADLEDPRVLDAHPRLPRDRLHPLLPLRLRFHLRLAFRVDAAAVPARRLPRRENLLRPNIGPGQKRA